MADRHTPRLIEELLPLTEIGIESSKSISHGAIHAIHTWFARRPLAAGYRRRAEGAREAKRRPTRHPAVGSK